MDSYSKYGLFELIFHYLKKKIDWIHKSIGKFCQILIGKIFDHGREKILFKFILVVSYK